jgi:hypothetical protein
VGPAEGPKLLLLGGRPAWLGSRSDISSSGISNQARTHLECHWGRWIRSAALLQVGRWVVFRLRAKSLPNHYCSVRVVSRFAYFNQTLNSRRLSLIEHERRDVTPFTHFLFCSRPFRLVLRTIIIVLVWNAT